MARLQASGTITLHRAAKDGKDGADGKSVVVADLDNEMDAVACDSEGKAVEAVTLVTNVSMFYGTEAMTLTQVTATNNHQGMSVTAQTSGRVECVVAKGNSIADTTAVTITVKGVRVGSSEVYTRQLTFTVTAVKQGKDGKTPVVYQIVPNYTTIKVDKNGDYTPMRVTAYVKGSDGSEGIPGGYVVRYRIDDAIKKDNNGNEIHLTDGQGVIVTSATKSIEFELLKGDNVVDRETIPVVKDGADGEESPGWTFVCDPITFTTDNSGAVQGLPADVVITARYGNAEANISSASIADQKHCVATASNSGSTAQVKITSIANSGQKLGNYNIPYQTGSVTINGYATVTVDGKGYGINFTVVCQWYVDTTMVWKEQNTINNGFNSLVQSLSGGTLNSSAIVQLADSITSTVRRQGVANMLWDGAFRQSLAKSGLRSTNALVTKYSGGYGDSDYALISGQGGTVTFLGLNIKSGKTYTYSMMYKMESGGSEYGFALNDNGYWESQNKGVNSSFALCRVRIVVDSESDVTVAYINSGESNWDYGYISNVEEWVSNNTCPFGSNNSADSSGIADNFPKKVNSKGVKFHSFGTLNTGTYVFWVKYIKDSSNNTGNDSFQFRVFGAAECHIENMTTTYGSISVSGNGDETSIPAASNWALWKCTFTPSQNLDSLAISCSNANMYLTHCMLTEGDSVVPYADNMGDVSSMIEQMADSITAMVIGAFGKSGIVITEEGVKLVGGKVAFVGADGETEYIRATSNGHFIFLQNGNDVYDLGPAGGGSLVDGQQGGTFSSGTGWKKIEGNLTESYILNTLYGSNGNTPSSVTAYQYNARYNTTTHQYGSDRIYDGKWYKRNNIEPTSTLWWLDDGYYIKSGMWPAMVNEIDGDSFTYTKTLCKVTDGAMVTAGSIEVTIANGQRSATFIINL